VKTEKLGGVGQNNFFRAMQQFFGQRPKMKNNILKIINEKYEKYSVGYSKIKCPKSEHFGMRHSFFSGAAPYFFFKIDPARLQKWPVRLWIATTAPGALSSIIHAALVSRFYVNWKLRYHNLKIFLMAWSAILNLAYRKFCPRVPGGHPA